MFRTGFRRLASLPLATHPSPGVTSSLPLPRHEAFLPSPSNPNLQTRFFDIYQMGSKEAIEKERARIKDEMSRGYFIDMSDLKKHGGKLAVANKTIIPAMEAIKFPALKVEFSDGRNLQLPVGSDNSEIDSNSMAAPSACLVCLSFRANSQAMIGSWTTPFLDAFSASRDVLVYEVSLIDSWFLSLGPIKRLLLKTMRKAKTDGKNDVIKSQIGYSFGDNYYFRKELRILNLLTGYMFLLDKFGRIRWHGFGQATDEELSSLMSCTSTLLKEKL